MMVMRVLSCGVEKSNEQMVISPFRLLFAHTLAHAASFTSAHTPSTFTAEETQKHIKVLIK